MSKRSEIVERHQPIEVAGAKLCEFCSTTARHVAWPCDVAQLSVRVAELEAAIRAVQGEHWGEEYQGGVACHGCARWMPCYTRETLDAVLPPEEQE